MAGLQDIRRRIRSVKNTQQVTKAMKMISAVKLRKAQERLLALRPYATRLTQLTSLVVGQLREQPPETDSPLVTAFLSPREEARIRVLLIASDKGLCGGFNANVLKAMHTFLASTSAELVHLDLVGKRSVDWARKHRLKGQSERTGLPLPSLLAASAEIAQDALRQYKEGSIDAFYVVYNYFHSPMSQVASAQRLFPITLDAESQQAAGVPHKLEPDPTTVLEAILPKFLETELLHCLLESSASEHGARMASMDKATSNAGEMIDKLTLHMNKVRQATITNQIIEVVSGANA